MKIIVGTKNPAKIEAVKNAFSNMESILLESVDVPSGVSEQPFSDEETIKGAVNRAKEALGTGGEIGIGLEGGVQQTEHGLFLCNWGALVVKGWNPIIAGGARIPLPSEVANRLLQGEELGPVMDDYAKKEDVRKKEGAVGIFTNGLVSREEMFSHVMKLLVGQYEYQKQKGDKQ